MSDIYFYKGQKNLLKDKEEKVAVEEIQKELLQVFDVQNLSFLFGAGCSSHVVEGNEVGIPVMAPMAEEFYGELEEVDKTYLTDTIKINIEDALYKYNLEKFLIFSKSGLKIISGVALPTRLPNVNDFGWANL